jgi:hypothetical protein
MICGSHEPSNRCHESVAPTVAPTVVPGAMIQGAMIQIKFYSNSLIQMLLFPTKSRHHPDKGGSTESFQRLQEAHEILSDPDKRRRYDDAGNESDGSDISLGSDNEGCDGDQTGEQTEDEEQQQKKTPIEICLMIVSDYAKENGIIREKNPKTGETKFRLGTIDHLATDFSKLSL